MPPFVREQAAAPQGTDARPLLALVCLLMGAHVVPVQRVISTAGLLGRASAKLARSDSMLTHQGLQAAPYAQKHSQTAGQPALRVDSCGGSVVKAYPALPLVLHPIALPWRWP